MNLGELTAVFRSEFGDKPEGTLYSDPDIARWLNEAVYEAAIRGRLLLEDGDASMCRVSVKAGRSTYDLHAAMYELSYTAYRREGCTERQPLKLVSREWLDRNMPDWRDREDDPLYLTQDERRLRLAPVPRADGVLLLEGYRVPIKRMVNEGDEPEIARLHHPYLVHWALFRAFSVPDADLFDTGRAISAEAEFTRYFGSRPDADLRRMTREDQPHHNEASWV